MNERKTETLVRDTLRELGHYDSSNDVSVEEQKSAIEAVKKSLRYSSQTGKGGSGNPEFFVHDASNPDMLIVVECKADRRDHASPMAVAGVFNDPSETKEERAKRTQRYAIDGVLHYASLLSREFNVIAIAVSGDSDVGTDISVFLCTKKVDQPRVLKTRSGATVDALIPWPDFVDAATFDPIVRSWCFSF